MTRLPISEHLTPGDADFDKRARQTHAGQAHLAGTGPKGKTCRQCVHWAFDGYLVSTSQLKNTICEKYTGLMGGREGGRIPHHALACKYFEANPDPPPVYDPKVR